MSDLTMRPPDWYFRFVADYCASFGTSPKFTEAMVRWWNAFAAGGFVEEDFAGALSDLILGTAAPQWDREHLPLVRRALNTARDRRVQRAVGAEPVAQGAPCRWCGWSGWVEVPDPRCLAEGIWLPPFRCVAPACTRCAPGRRKYERVCEMAEEKLVSAGRPMTLDSYELRYGNGWIGVVARHQEAQRLMRLAESENETLTEPTTHKNLIRAVADGFGRVPGKHRAA